jgi:hypothetical protein
MVSGPVRRLAAAALVLSSLAAAPMAAAQAAGPAAGQGSAPAATPTADQIAKAKTLFDLGAKAYDAENFSAAIQAFQEAYRLSQRPGPVFSAAQSYRRLYNTDRKLDTLRQAIAYYKLYIEKQKAGGRLAEAQQSLRDLEAVLAALGGSAGSEPVAAATDTKPKPRLMVSSPTKGAMASLDGGEMSDLPLFQDLAPGDHTLRLAAEGHFDDERVIAAGEEGLYGLDIPLREKPALLTIKTDTGAAISIDGRAEGTAPLLKPLQLPSGTHLVTILRNGYQPYSAELDLRRDERRPLEVGLARTTQREAAYGVLGVAGAGVLAGAFLAGFAVMEQGRAQDIEELKQLSPITEAQRAEHEASAKNRDDLRLAAVSTFGGSVILALVGTGLFVFDRPVAGLPTKLRDETPGKPAAKQPPKRTVSVLPFVGPAGGGVIASFDL